MEITSSTSRRLFFTTAGTGLLGSLAMAYPRNELDSQQSNVGLSADYPSTPLADLRAVVGSAHANLDVVRELVTARPELAKATYDWGYGDVESALGAASHMGRKDIADFLMEHGARPNLFTFAMLGKVDAVQAMVEARPGVQRTLGPHGFTLMHHARMRLNRENVEGSEKAEQERLVEYLESLGDADVGATSLDISDEAQQTYLGKYTLADEADEYFEVKLNDRNQLSIARGEQFGRALLRVGDHVFAPGGAPSVRIQFEMVDGAARSLTIHDPDPIITLVKGM